MNINAGDTGYGYQNTEYEKRNAIQGKIPNPFRHGALGTVHV
jgi:hypothetical protein